MINFYRVWLHQVKDKIIDTSDEDYVDILNNKFNVIEKVIIGLEELKNKIKGVENEMIVKCKECKKIKEVGKDTRQCLECLDWKCGDLCK